LIKILALSLQFYWAMTIKIGTIEEMTGQGFEILVDSETRTFVLAKFYDGNFLGVTTSMPNPSKININEPTLATAEL
jgi:hypothetical protein